MHQPPFITSEPNLRHRMIFSANPGRSGSAFLARLLDSSPIIDAGHERDPAMTGPWLRRVAYRGPAESYEDRQIKVAAIRSELTHLADGMIYADTSHLFLKTFADVVLDAFPHELITVIALRRSPLLTARSYFQLGTLGPNRLPWHGWVPFPTAPGMRFRIEPEAVQNQFDLIFGSFVDLVARMNDFRSRTPSLQWIDADLESITAPAGAVCTLHRARDPGTARPRRRADRSCQREAGRERDRRPGRQHRVRRGSAR